MSQRKTAWRKRVMVLVVATAALAGARRGRGDQPPIPPASIPLPDAALRTRFVAGLEAFSREESASTGLGPGFNAKSCVACHHDPAAGGASDTTVQRFGKLGPRGFDPLLAEGGPVVQSHGLVLPTCTVAGEQVPPDATIATRRDTPALFGLGYIDAIPDGRILRYADPDDRDHDGVSGRANLIDGRVARFGWKAQVTTLHDFVAAALLNELGITTREFPEELLPQGQPTGCDPAPDPEDDGTRVAALTDFITFLAPPPHIHLRATDRGRSVFHRAGCASCHRPRLRSTFPMPTRRVALFSDLLLHDMGAELADGVEQGSATGAEFRTPPLWGVGQSAPYLHDGRAATLTAAIAAHGGEAERARNSFLALPRASRSALLAYLRSL